MQEYILLLNERHSILLRRGGKRNTKFGVVDLRDVEYGDIVEVGKQKFVVTKPTFIDMLSKCRRGAQIVTPKDAAQVIAITGLSQGWKCLDAGTGSGFMSIFLANIVGKKGKIITYEKRKEFYEIAKNNFKMCGLKNIIAKNEDVKNFRERNLDLIFFDMKGSPKLIEKASRRLKPGGWLVVYSPHIEQQIEAREEMKKNRMNVYTTVENIARKWKSLYGYTHPVISDVVHTGFMTFARKV